MKRTTEEKIVIAVALVTVSCVLLLVLAAVKSSL